MTLKQILKKYPKAHLYYHDSGSWILYTSKADFKQLEKCEDDDYDYWEERINLLEGDDSLNSKGYAPSIVVELAKLLGLTVDSI